MEAGFSRLAPNTIDDYLGPSEQRFFGSGYRRVIYGMRGIRITSYDDLRIELEAMLSIEYPADWSKKSGRSLRPHFSTLDALILGAELVEMCVARTHDLSAVDVRHAWIRRVRISAGSTPQEDLEGVKAVVHRRSAPDCESFPDAILSTFDCTIGTMRVQLDVVHPRGERFHRSEWAYEDRSAALCRPEYRYYGDGFKAWRQDLHDVRVDLPNLTADGRLHITPGSHAGPWPFGLEADYQPSASLLDLVVASSQLTQVLLYGLDGLRRENSQTLWMRRISIMVQSPYRIYTDEGLPVSISIVDSNVLTMGESHWRAADVLGNFAGVTLRSAVAHRLRHDNAAQRTEVS